MGVQSVRRCLPCQTDLHERKTVWGLLLGSSVGYIFCLLHTFPVVSDIPFVLFFVDIINNLQQWMHKKTKLEGKHTVDIIRIFTIHHLGGFPVAYNFYHADKAN